MNVMSAVVAAPAIAFPSLAVASSVDRSVWDAALARYKAITAEVDRVGKSNMAIHDAAESTCPRNGEWFGRYGLGIGDSRDSQFRAVHMSLVIERAKGRHLTAEEAQQVTIDANNIVDEFEAYCVRRNAAFAGYDRLAQQFDTLIDEQMAAYHALMDTPAPDGAALEYKIGLLAAQLTAWESEDADSLNAVHADARRLLTQGRA